VTDAEIELTDEHDDYDDDKSQVGDINVD